MHELTLTGATLLSDGPGGVSPAAKRTSNAQQQQNTTFTSSSPFTTGHDHSHAHHHHHSNSNKTCCDGPHVAARPVLTLKKPAAELATEYDDTQMYMVCQQVVRMGNYELLEEIVEAWKKTAAVVRKQNGADDKEVLVVESSNRVNAKLQEYDAAGHTLLHWSAKRVDDVRFVHFFLALPFAAAQQQQQFPTPVHRPTRDDTSMTALHWACTQDNALAIVKTLLDATTTTAANGTTTTTTPTGLELRDATGCTPLLIAAQHGHVETVAYLIQKGADLQQTDSSHDSATHWAAYKGSERVLGLLSFYDTRPLRTADAYGQTPLHLASLRGHVSVVRYILQLLLNPPAVNTKAARLAAAREVKELLFLKDQNGRTPYELAVHKEKPAVAAVLQQAADKLTKKSWQSQLQRALTYKSLKNLCTIKTCKVWLGLPEVDDVDESPKFPYYYVIAVTCIHVVYYFSVFVPVASTASGLLWDCMVLHVIEILLIGVTCYCLWKCGATDPGRLNANHPGIAIWRRLYEQTLDAYAADDARIAEQARQVQLCHTCHIARPARSKHDRFSRACILQFDHHCPFVGTSVGLYNYKWFLGFITCMTAYLFNFWILLVLYYRRLPPSGTATPVSTLVIGVVLGLHIFFPAGMLLYHLQLVFVNLTTNEHLNVAKYDYLWETPTNTAGDDGNNTSSSSRRRFYNPWDKGLLGNLMDRIRPGDHCYLLPEQEERNNNADDGISSRLLSRDEQGQLLPNLSSDVV